LTNNEEDILLWESYKSGDRKAFANIFRKFYPMLFQFGTKLTSKEDLCEDCIQELFIELWNNKSKTSVQSVKAYLFKALKYKLLRALNQQNVPPIVGEDSGVEVSYEALFIAFHENEERSARVAKGLEQLSNRQKEIIYLKYYQQLTYEEVSEVMNINYQAARNLLYQSVKALRSIISQDAPG
jgi:RNA polymerase sigma factor (sigma-70 family)